MSTQAKLTMTVVVLAGLAVGGYYAYEYGRRKKDVVDETVETVQAQLDGLDPVSRAAVVAKLASDETKGLRGRIGAA